MAPARSIIKYHSKPAFEMRKGVKEKEILEYADPNVIQSDLHFIYKYL